MSTYRLKKVVAVCFLEATKSALDHLGQYRIELSNQRMEPPSDLTTFYGDVRRMRDYLHRCVGAFNDVVELELGKEDRGLLVACATRAVEVIDLRLETGQQLSEQEREWLERKRQVLSNWAVEFAEKPLLHLPLPRLSPVPTHGVKMLISRVQTKLYGPGGNELGLSETGTLPGQVATGASRTPQAPASGKTPSASAPVAQPVAAPTPLATTAGSETGPLMDPRQIRDPRLRTLMSLDLRAYERAMEARDHRLASVHLASILEGAVLDHALPRRAELGLVGSPDSWNPQEILLRILGQDSTPKDRSMAHQVFMARNLVRPMVQLLQPSVVTPASLVKMSTFVREVLRKMGFKGGPRPGSQRL